MPEWVKAICAVVSVLMSALAIWIAHRQRMSEAQKKAWKDLEQRIGRDKKTADERHVSNTRRMDEISGQLAVITERLEHVPDKEEIGKLYELIRGVSKDVSRIEAGVSKVEGAQSQVTRTVELINQFLMGGKS